MYQFIHAADLHLDSALRGLERYEGAPVNEIRSATRRAFDNLIDLAIKHKVAFVLLAGDLFDGDWTDYNTGLYFVGRLNQLRQSQIQVFIISGNHDAESHMTRSLRMPDNVQVFATDKPQTHLLADLHCAIHGQGFANRAVTEDLSLNYPEPVKGWLNIALLHTCLDGKPGHLPYAPCSVAGLVAKGYDYWALGHIHKREIIHEKPWIVFSGNIQGRHIRETGGKGCYLVSIENGCITDVEHQALDVLRWNRCDVDVSKCSDREELFRQIEHVFEEQQKNAENRPLALRLVLRGRSEMHLQLHTDVEQIEQDCRAIANASGEPSIWLQKLELQTAPATDRARRLAVDSAISGLLRSIAVQIKEGEAQDLSTDEIDTLLRRLPKEARNEELLDIKLTDQREQILKEVEYLLLSELSQEEGL